MEQELLVTKFVREKDRIQQSMRVIIRSGDVNERDKAGRIICDILKYSVYAGGKKSWHKAAVALHRLGSAVFTDNIYARCLKLELFAFTFGRLVIFEGKRLNSIKK